MPKGIKHIRFAVPEKLYNRIKATAAEKGLTVPGYTRGAMLHQLEEEELVRSPEFQKVFEEVMPGAMRDLAKKVDDFESKGKKKK